MTGEELLFDLYFNKHTYCIIKKKIAYSQIKRQYVKDCKQQAEEQTKQKQKSNYVYLFIQNYRSHFKLIELNFLDMKSKIKDSLLLI